jgi:hypothetical protein
MFAMIARHVVTQGGAVFEAAEGILFVLRTAQSESEARALAAAAGPDALLFAVQPLWGVPAAAWVAADPDFWHSNPSAPHFSRMWDSRETHRY